MNDKMKFLEKRSAEIKKNIQEAIKFFDLEVDVRNFVRQKIIKGYMPNEEELKKIIKQEVILQAGSIDTLSEAINKQIEDIVRERIKDLADEYKEVIKDEIMDRINEY